MRSSCGFFGVFMGAAHIFPYIWRVFLFVRFRFENGILQSVHFDWVGYGGGEDVGDLWRRIVREGINDLRSCWGGFGGFEGTD